MSNPNSACEDTDGFVPCIIKKKRSLPGNPDPDAEVIALSPRSLMATNRFVCEICNKGFQRDQNLQLHRRGHNLPWKLKQKASHEVKKKVYICPETTCVHHDPARALGDLTGIKKHFSRKHGEKKWKCDKCSKRYAVQSDWKAHQKTCGTREYRCGCGTLFSRRDSFITHRAFCDALAEENAKVSMHIQQGTEIQQDMRASSFNDHNSHMASLGGDHSAPMKASSSPTSQITRDGFAYAEVSKPPFTDNRASDFASSEGSIVPKWMPGHAGNIKPNFASSGKNPGLSLYLGMGPGPGPPGSAGTNLSTSSFDYPSLDTLQKLAFPNIPSSQSYDTHMLHTSSAMGAMGMLSSLFSSPRPVYAHRDVGNSSMFSSFGYPEYMSQLVDEQPFQTPSSRLSTSMLSTMSTGSENQSKGSSHHAASSATALLQKAAQMGATASKPFLLQKFGIGSEAQDNSMQRHPTWQGVSSMFSSSNKEAGQAGEYISHAGKDIEVAADASIATCVPRREMVSGYGSMLEFMESVSAGGNGLLKNGWDGMPSSTGLAAQSSASTSYSAPPGLCSLQKGEPQGDTPMVDFLGVGGSSGMVGFFPNCRNQDGNKRTSHQSD